MRAAFADRHPAVNFLYFLLVLGFGMFCMHPVFLAVSLACALLCGRVLRGPGQLGKLLLRALPLILLTALINPLFSHAGATILCYLPGGNPLTLESICFGIAAGFMLAGVLCWFSCWNVVITSDKFVYLFGKAAPGLSLILAMALRFVPRFLEQFKAVSQAQRALGQSLSQGSLRRRLRAALQQTSILITWSLENAVDTADSMKGRGYGLSGRTAFSIYTLTRRDLWLLLWLLAAGAYVTAGAALGAAAWSFYPVLSGAGWNGYHFSVYLCYAALCLTPAVLGLWEEFRWHCLQSKI